MKINIRQWRSMNVNERVAMLEKHVAAVLKEVK